MEADISVIVPVFNGADHVANCLESLLAQELSPREIIIVDNGSTDETLSILRKYPGIHVLHESSPGVGMARNTGARAARGSILAFLDIDCRANATWLSRAYEIFRNCQEVDGLVGKAEGINNSIWALFFQRSYDLFIREIEDQDGRLLKIDSKNFFLRQKVFWEVGGFDPSIGNSEDVDLGARLHLSGFRVVFAASVQVCHVNPVCLDSRIKVRREQGYFDYKIFKKIPRRSSVQYYPAFARPYSDYLFVREPPLSKGFFVLLSLLAKNTTRVAKSILLLCNKIGLSRFLYPLYHFCMASAIFEGKLGARRVETGYTTLQKLVHSGEFSRRLIG